MNRLEHRGAVTLTAFAISVIVFLLLQSGRWLFLLMPWSARLSRPLVLRADKRLATLA